MFPTAVLVLVIAAPPAAPEPADAFQQAERLYASDRFGEAEPLYQRALAANDRFLKRQAHNRLLALYVRSGRPDKALQHSAVFRDWLKKVGGEDGFAALDLLAARCHLELGYPDAAETELTAALEAKTPLAPDRRLEARRLHAEVAIQKKDTAEKNTLAELETDAAAVLKDATRDNDGSLRVTAGRYLAESLFRRGDIAGALATLAPFPALHDKLGDPLGRRDTQWQRAKLLAAQGKFADAEPLFKEALELHSKYQPKRRLIAGDIQAEWSVAAVVAGKPAEAAQTPRRGGNRLQGRARCPGRQPGCRRRAGRIRATSNAHAVGQAVCAGARRDPHRWRAVVRRPAPRRPFEVRPRRVGTDRRRVSGRAAVAPASTHRPRRVQPAEPSRAAASVGEFGDCGTRLRVARTRRSVAGAVRRTVPQAQARGRPAARRMRLPRRCDRGPQGRVCRRHDPLPHRP